MDPRSIAGTGATVGHVLTWAGTQPKWSPPAGGAVDQRMLFLLAYSDNSFPSKAMPSQPSLLPLSVALDNGFQDTSGTFMFATTGRIEVGQNWFNAPTSDPDYTGLGFLLTRMADSSGTLLAPVQQESTSGAELFSSTGGVVTGTAHSGTLFDTGTDDPAVQINLAGLYHVYVFLSWV